MGGRGSMRSTVVAIAGVMLAAGCGRLHADRGHDFAIAVPSTVPVVVNSTPSLTIRVSGCDDFDVHVQTGNGSVFVAPVAGTSAAGAQPVSATVTLSDAALGAPGATCIVNSAVRLAMIVTCRDQDRAKREDFVAICIPTSPNRAGPGRLLLLSKLFSSNAPLHPNWFGEAGSLELYSAGGDTYYGLGRPSQLVSTCDYYGSCVLVEGQAGGSTVVVQTSSGQTTSLHVTPVGEQVLDAVPQDDGVLLLSSGPGAACSCAGPGTCYSTTTFLRFEDATGTSRTLAALPGEVSLTGLVSLRDGRRAFVTVGVIDAPQCASGYSGNALYRTDGATLEKDSMGAGTDIVAGVPADAAFTAVWPSDDVTTWVAVGGSRVYRGSPDAGWERLTLAETRLQAGWQLEQVVWLGSELALGYEVPGESSVSAAVDVITTASPPTPVFSSQSAAVPSAPALLGMLAYGNRLILTSRTGLTILDGSGETVVAADPLVPSGYPVTAAAVWTSPSSVAVAAGPDVYVYDVTTGRVLASPADRCADRCGGPDYAVGHCPETCAVDQICLGPFYRACAPIGTPPPVVPEGLVSWWPADGDLLDHAGSNDAISAGHLQYTEGVSGQAFLFDGYGIIGFYVDGLPLGDADRTLALWVRLDESPQDWAGEAFFAGYGFAFVGNDAFELTSSVTTPGCISPGWSQWGWGFSTSPCLELGTWYHVTATYESDLVVVWVNGVPRAEGRVDIDTLNAPGYIGSLLEPGESAPPRRRFVGAIDDVRIYDRALSAEEISLLAMP